MRPWSHAVPRSALALALVLGVLLAAGTPVALGSGATQSVGGPPVTMTVSLDADGDATWNVTTTVPIESPSDRRAFEELATEFRRGEGPGPSATLFRRAAAAASQETGREMQIKNVERTAIPGNATGRLTLTFTWTNFARTPVDRVVVGDAFNTTNGTWLPGLTASQTLIIRSPPDYGVESAPPVGIQNGVVRLEGPATFEPGYLSITYEHSGPLDQDPSGWFDLGLLPLAGLALLALAILASGIYLWRRRETPAGPGPITTEPNGGEPDGETAPESAPVTDGTAGAAGAVDEELLSDEERVERLLAQNGGRMKQADIVSETGWSNAKVSQLLSSMAEADRVNKLRIGRENLISLPDEDIAEFE